MKSWAQTYLAGAVVGTALIVAAFVAFVPLVSLQAPQDWSVPGLGLQDSAGSGSVNVGSAVAVSAAGTNDAPREVNSTVGGDPGVTTPAEGGAAIRTAAPLDVEDRGGRNGKAETGGSATETAAIAPASAKAVARNPGSLTPKGADAPLPPPSVKPTEPSDQPGPAAAEEEGRGEGGTTTGAPIPTRVVTPEEEEPEVLPPPAEVPVPPREGSPETGGVTEPPVGDEESEVAQPGDGDVPVNSGLDLEPGADGAKIADRSLTDLALAAPGLVDVTADRQQGALRFDR